MFSIPCTEENKDKLIRAIDQSERFFCLLNSNSYQDKYSASSWKISYGNRFFRKDTHAHAFDELKQYIQKDKNYFGFLSYDLKNDVEKLSSKNNAFINFPSVFFFEEEVSIEEQNGTLFSSHSLDFDWVENTEEWFGNHQKYSLHQKVSKEEYLKKIDRIKQHILDGDVYELNYCIPFEIEDIDIDPILLYQKLNKRSPNPFSGILKIDQQYIISASPERYLCKRENKLISQPIKGTIKRSEDISRDINELGSSIKERAENVMIVDLVRNDLTRTSKTGSIKVEELFGIYTFPQLHQMISTVVSELAEGYTAIDAIEKSFPMGSMTGAPKVRAMQLIDELESFRRGPYSGAMGYFSDTGDIDFNVLIRSIFIDKETKKLFFAVGSAITIDSDPEQEYEECLLKAKAIMMVLVNGDW